MLQYTEDFSKDEVLNLICFGDLVALDQTQRYGNSEVGLIQPKSRRVRGHLPPWKFVTDLGKIYALLFT